MSWNAIRVLNRCQDYRTHDKLLEGTGKLIRHIRLNGKSDLKSDAVKGLFESAVEQGRTMALSKGGIQPARVVVNRSLK